MEKWKTDSCVFRVVVDGKVALIMAVHADDMVIAGTDETRRLSSCISYEFFLEQPRRIDLVYKFRFQTRLGNGDTGLISTIEIMLNAIAVNSPSDIPATPVVEGGPRTEKELEEIGRTGKLWAAWCGCRP